MEVFEELGRGDAAYAFALSMHNAVANTVARFGRPSCASAARGAYVSGELLGGFSLTEPHAGLGRRRRSRRAPCRTATAGA